MAFFQITDVAKNTGVTESTVVMVINGVKGIEPSVKMKVFNAMKDMSYKANITNANPEEKNPKIIAIFSSVFFTSLFPTRIVYGVEQKLKQIKFNLHKYTTESNHEYEIIMLMNVLNEIKPFGLIGIYIKPEKAVLDAYKKAGIPSIIVEEKVEGYSTISVDNYRGGYIATEYLIKKGRKKIGLICGMIDREGGYNAKLRYEGYKKALEDGGLAFDKKMVFETSDYSSEDGMQAMQKFYDDRTKPDAIFCASGDTAATGLMKKAASYGIKIPDDIALVGYDDTDIAALTNPSLTTIRQPIVEIGEKAFELITEFKDEILKKPEDIVFKPELIQRNSA